MENKPITGNQGCTLQWEKLGWEKEEYEKWFVYTWKES